MPIEISELVIKASIVSQNSDAQNNENPATTSRTESQDLKQFRDSILMECKSLIREMLDREKDR
ncbi:MAG: hypothetical protein ACI86H_001579 [bacterium]|jgi:hypothetical protein